MSNLQPPPYVPPLPPGSSATPRTFSAGELACLIVIPAVLVLAIGITTLIVCLVAPAAPGSHLSPSAARIDGAPAAAAPQAAPISRGEATLAYIKSLDEIKRQKATGNGADPWVAARAYADIAVAVRNLPTANVDSEIVAYANTLAGFGDQAAEWNRSYVAALRSGDDRSAAYLLLNAMSLASQADELTVKRNDAVKLVAARYHWQLSTAEK